MASASADARGLLGIEGAAPQLGDLTLEILVTTSSPSERVDAMFAAWRERCPIYLALLEPNRIALTTSVA